MTPTLGILALLLAQPAAAPAPTARPGAAGWIVASASAAHRAGQRLRHGATVSASLGGTTTVLTRGHCLAVLAPGASLRLSAPAPGQRCSVRVLKGWVRLTGPTARAPIAVVLGKTTVTLRGRGIARRDKVTGLCVLSGKAEWVPTYPPTSTSRPPGPLATVPGGGSKFNSVGPTQCVWLSAGVETIGRYSPAVAAADRQRTSSVYGYKSPATAVAIDLSRELKDLSVASHGSAESGGDVEGGGQSMCLETGAESNAVDPESAGTDVTKPPPPTQLRLRINIVRRP